MQGHEHAALLGDPIEKHDVQHDPTDGKQTVRGAEQRSASGHRHRHPDHDDRNGKSRRQTGERGQVRGNSPERQESKKYDKRKRRDDRRQRPVQRIVVLLPGHDAPG